MDEGIFRKPKPNSGINCEIPYDLTDGSSGTASVVFEQAEEGSSRIKAPLNLRGWTFQERK
jgi:hypothetical protein